VSGWWVAQGSPPHPATLFLKARRFVSITQPNPIGPLSASHTRRVWTLRSALGPEASECPRGPSRKPPGQGIAAVAVHAVVVPPVATPTPPSPSPQEEPSRAAWLLESPTRGEKGAERSLGCPRIAL
jgi:hypothetical protein